MISASASRAAVRTVAIFEAAKGAFVLLAGFGLLGLLHRDAGELAEDLVGRLHLDPSHRFPAIFIEAASHVNDQTLWLFAAGAFAFSLIRLAEAYGLWHERA